MASSAQQCADAAAAQKQLLLLRSADVVAASWQFSSWLILLSKSSRRRRRRHCCPRGNYWRQTNNNNSNNNINDSNTNGHGHGYFCFFFSSFVDRFFGFRSGGPLIDRQRTRASSACVPVVAFGFALGFAFARSHENSRARRFVGGRIESFRVNSLGRHGCRTRLAQIKTHTHTAVFDGLLRGGGGGAGPSDGRAGPVDPARAGTRDSRPSQRFCARSHTQSCATADWAIFCAPANGQKLTAVVVVVGRLVG